LARCREALFRGHVTHFQVGLFLPSATADAFAQVTALAWEREGENTVSRWAKYGIHPIYFFHQVNNIRQYGWCAFVLMHEEQETGGILKPAAGNYY